MPFPIRPKPYSLRKNPTKQEFAWLSWTKEMLEELEKRYEMLVKTYEPNHLIAVKDVKLMLIHLLIAFGKESFEKLLEK